MYVLLKACLPISFFKGHWQLPNSAQETKHENVSGENGSKGAGSESCRIRYMLTHSVASSCADKSPPKSCNAMPKNVT